MKKFLKKIAWFFLPVILVACAADYFLSKNLAKSVDMAQGEYLVWEDIYNSNVNAEVTINGSSRAWMHFDPAIMEAGLGRPVYNLGIDGHNFLLQDFRYRELLKHDRAPKYIVYSVDIFTLTKREDLYNSMQFLPYMLWNKDLYDATSQYKGFSFWDATIPLVRYSGQREAIGKALDIARGRDNDKPKRHKGYFGNEENWNSDLEKAKKTMKRLTIPIMKDQQRAFEDFLAECRENRQRVILVYSPEEIEGQQFVANRKKIVDIYRDIAKRHGLTYLDYSNDEMCSDKQYFYNALHLNRKGSALFTAKLVEDLKRTNPDIAAGTANQ